MDPNTQALLMGAASGSADKLYIEDVFSTWLHTGNGGSQTTTNGIDLSGEGGLVWIKCRNSAGTENFLQDTQRGVNKILRTDRTDGESTISLNFSFNSDGFSQNNNLIDTNRSPNIYTSWTFRKAPKFFDVVTWTGTGANRTIAHNLGSVPGCIMVKRTDTTADWQVYHNSIANTEYLVLNSTAGKATGTTRWNSTTPTSTVFSLGTDATVNASGGTYVAYLFAHDDGGFGDGGNESAIKCGSFTTDGSGDATVDLGWEPQFLIVKSSSTTSDWIVLDIMRGMDNTTNARLHTNLNTAETTSGLYAKPTATGFTYNEASNQTSIYIAIRRGPMKTPTDATKVFSPTVYAGTNTDNREVYTGIVTDMAWARRRNSSTVDGMVVGDRLRGQPYLLTGTANAEVNDADAFDQQLVSTTEYGTAWSSMTGFFVGNDATANINVNTSLDSNVVWAFRRARGFFDIVAWTASATTSISHNLGVAPELIIAKPRDTASDWWAVYTQSGGRNNVIYLNTTNDQIPSINFWGTSDPTSTTFGVASLGNTNNIGNMIAYLFASCPGVSKVGSYTGTSATLDIDCGFTTGARLVIIKRTDAYDNWYCWDTARGITASNDPYLVLDTTTPEVTTTNYIGPLNTGFQLTSAGLATVNVSGGSYIYLAIA